MDGICRAAVLCGRCHIRDRMKGDLSKFNYPVDYELNKPQTLMKDLDPEPYTIAAGSVPNHTFEAIPPAKTIQFGVDEKSGKPKMQNSCMLYCHTKETATIMDEKYKTMFKK